MFWSQSFSQVVMFIKGCQYWHQIFNMLKADETFKVIPNINLTLHLKLKVWASVTVFEVASILNLANIVWPLKSLYSVYYIFALRSCLSWGIDWLMPKKPPAQEVTVMMNRPKPAEMLRGNWSTALENKAFQATTYFADWEYQTLFKHENTKLTLSF